MEYFKNVAYGSSESAKEVLYELLCSYMEDEVSNFDLEMGEIGFKFDVINYGESFSGDGVEAIKENIINLCATYNKVLADNKKEVAEEQNRIFSTTTCPL